MKIPKWFERKFPERPILENFPFVIERLRGAPARVEERVSGLTPARATTRLNDAWSIQEQIGHLGDLEGLWYGRVDDLVAGEDELRPADLTNQKTHEAVHNESALEDLLVFFRSERQRLVDRLDGMEIDHAGLTALHPRLGQPMRLIDLCHFVADHDDHHLAMVTAILAATR